jgi:hypothetical protein
MRDLQSLQKTYQQLSKVAGLILSDDSYLTGDMEMLRDTFVTNLYSIIKRSLDCSVTSEKLQQYTDTTKDQSNDLTGTLKFMTETLENPITYTLLNYYLASFIASCIEHARSEKENELWELLQKEQVYVDVLKLVDRDFHNLTHQHI